MKSIKYSFAILMLLAIIQLPAQENKHRCFHKQSFEKSLISDTLDAMSYEIHLNDINTSEKTIEGYCVINLASKVNNLDNISLELLDLNVDSVFVDGDKISEFSHSDPLLVIYPGTILNIGDEAEVTVFYHGQPFHEDWGGFHFSGSYAFNLGVGFVSDPHNLGKAWFPCIDDFHDRAFYDVFVTLDESKMAVCGGTLIEEINNGNGTKTFHWKLNCTIPTYLASVAVGEYVAVMDTFESIRGQIPVAIYVRPNDSSKVEGSFATLQPVFEAYEYYFGPYEWERIGYVGTSKGAMEHTTNIAYPHFCITGTLAYESLFAHELSHQYFGNMVTCESAEEMWLNEGWAVFCESIYREGIYGKEAYNENMRAKHKEVLHLTHVVDGGYRALYGIPTEYTYGSTVYDKGAIVTHTLRGYLGDELFFPAVKAYLQEYKFDYASSWDLRDFLDDFSGVDLTDFFEFWVFSPGFSEFSVDSFAVVPAGSNFNATVYVRQKLKGATVFPNLNRLEITFMDENWQQQTELMEFSGEYSSQTFLIPFSPKLVLPDLFNKVADATIDFDMVIKTTGTEVFTDTYAKLTTEEISSGDSAFVRITHRWVAPDSLKTPQIGLTLSDYRHWRVEGLFPDGFDATGHFYYSKFNHLDNTLITNLNDSLVILYRPTTAADWQSVYFIKTGSPYLGYIDVPHLQKGEYTLAVWDEIYIGQKEFTPTVTDKIGVYPNPANSEVFIVFGSVKPSVILIYNSAGLLVDEINVSDSEVVKWIPQNMPKGTYLLKFINKDNRVFSTKKLILN